MKFLITGAGGQLGREFVRRLSEEDKNVLSLPREKLDITNFPQVREVIEDYKPDYVINCAAYNFVDKAEEDSKKAFLVNGTGVKNLLLSCMATGAVLIHFSTDYVFDGRRKHPYTITDVPNPINEYGKSKLLGEETVLHGGYSRYYLIRTSWVFGDGKSSFVMKLFNWMEGNESLKIVKDQVSSPTYTKDLAGAVLDLIQTQRFGLYHITNTEYCSRYEWAKFITENIKWGGKVIPINSEEFSSLAESPSFSALYNFPLEETIGYSLPGWKNATQRFLKERGHIA